MMKEVRGKCLHKLLQIRADDEKVDLISFLVFFFVLKFSFL
jgi:hypothetical protein